MNDQCQMLDVERIGYGPCLGWGISPKSDLNRNGVVSGFHWHEINPLCELVQVHKDK